MSYQKNNTTYVVHKKLSYQIVGCLFDVFNELGYGFQEKYYERALCVNFGMKKIAYKKQVPYKLYVKGKFIGIFYFDFLIKNKIILEIKKGNYFPRQNIEQIKNYLQVSNLQLGIIANFTPHGIKYTRILNPNNPIKTI